MKDTVQRTLWFSRLKFLVPVITISVGILIYLWEPVPLQILRNATFDQYQRWQPRDYQDAPVHIIDIDDESLRRLGQWPWPRTLVAELVSRLQDSQAAAIAFDNMFAEPDRTSPQAMMELWRPPPDLRRQLSRMPDPDTVLAKTIGRGNVVLGFAMERNSARKDIPAIKAHFVVMGASPYPFLPDFSGTVPSLPSLEAAAAGNGALTFVPDADGVVRRVPLLMRQGTTLLPTLSAEALRVAQGAKNYIIRSAQEQGIGLNEVRIGALTVPTTPKGEIWVHYSRPTAARYIPAWKVLAGEVPAAQLANDILLIGTSAQGLMDLRFSPMGGIIPGVEIHAQVLEQLLSGIELNRPSWAGAVEALIIVGGGIVVGIIGLNTGALFSSFAFLLLLTSLWAAAWRAFVTGGLLLDPVIPSLALSLTFISSSIVRHFSIELSQRWVKQAFSRYVSPNLVTHLIEHHESLELGGRRQQCSFIFTDLVGFTPIIESMDPGDAVALLNAYLDRMIAIAFSHNGTLDRIVGDAVAIMFSAPVEQPDHQRRALLCALEMQRFSRQYADDLNAKGIPFGQTRMGIHSGEVIVGNFGGAAMFDYRALGDPVNTASRLESVNKNLGTLVCVSEATLSGCPDMPARPIGRLILKGKSHPLMVFEPLDPLTGGKVDEDYMNAFELMRSERPEALEAFEHLATQRQNDPLVTLHLSRLRAGIAGDLINTERRSQKPNATFKG